MARSNNAMRFEFEPISFTRIIENSFICSLPRCMSGSWSVSAQICRFEGYPNFDGDLQTQQDHFQRFIKVQEKSLRLYVGNYGFRY